MEALGWIAALFFLWLFGRSSVVTAPGQFSQLNSVPTVADNTPVITNQNQQNTPANQPPPWGSSCQPSPLPILPIAIIARNPLQQPPYVAKAPSRVTFSQPAYRAF
jgi:hypothetical protein